MGDGLVKQTQGPTICNHKSCTNEDLCLLFYNVINVNCHMIFTEQGLGRGLMSSKGHAIMECGL